MPANMENSAVATGLENVSFHSSSKKDNAKECSNYRTITLISLASKVVVKILQARFPWYRNSRSTSSVQKRQRNQRSNCQHSLDHRKSKGIPENIYFYLIDYTKAFDSVDHKKLWKILKEMGIPDRLTCLLQNLYAGQVTTEPDMEQWIGSKLGKEYIKAVYCQPVYLLYRQSCCYSVTKLCLTLCNSMNCSM